MRAALCKDSFDSLFGLPRTFLTSLFLCASKRLFGRSTNAYCFFNDATLFRKTMPQIDPSRKSICTGELKTLQIALRLRAVRRAPPQGRPP